jgi:hypothetical protein
MLNEAQKRSLAMGIWDIARRLEDLEFYLTPGEQPNPYMRYLHDLSADEVRLVRDGFARLRSVMLAFMQANGVTFEVPPASLRWALQVNVAALHVTVAELGPSRMRGYGPLAEEDRTAVEQLRRELEPVLDELTAALRPVGG